MANTIRALAALPAALVLGLTGCGSPAPDPYDPSLTAAAVCVGEETPDDLEDLSDRDLVVVPDSYCPIGDGAVEGYPYWWVYSDAVPVGSELDVPGVGDTFVLVGGWSTTRPARVSTVNLSRGVFPAPGRYTLGARGQVIPKTAVQPGRITPVTPTRAPSITRGGLGVPGARATGAPTPAPSRAAAAPGPTRAAVPSQANTAPRAGAPQVSAPAAKVPPRPAGSRPMGSGSSVRSGRR